MGGAFEIDIDAYFAGRRELLDPRLTFPTWHKHAREDASRVASEAKICPASLNLTGITDPALAKVHAWNVAKCNRTSEGVLTVGPLMHPSGRSYASLAMGLRAPDPSWVKTHVRAFHVQELSMLDASLLSSEERALAAIPPTAWESLAGGESLMLTSNSLVLADHGQLGLATLRLYPRARWSAFAEGASIALVLRTPDTACSRPASSTLCMQRVSDAEKQRPRIVAATVASGLLAGLAAIAMVTLSVASRRRVQRDRLHVLRTLTHELRTPAASIGFDIEPLRAAYDDLPLGCQEPMLRLSDSVERLQRVLHRTARYMALFENPGAAASLLRFVDVASVRAMLEEMAEVWPEDVTIVAGAQDRSVCTDPDWLSVALRNLVENALHHGARPVRVVWLVLADELVLRVTDAGTSTQLSLRKAIEPFDRAAQSDGLGLGLAIVDRIATLLGGRLRHEPSPTTFELRLPIVRKS